MAGSEGRHLEGAVGLVTGGAKGIGAAVVRHLCSQGAQVVVADVDQDAGADLAEEVGGVFVPTDVTKLEDNVAAVERAVASFGQLDLVHLNAGVTSGCGVGEDFDLGRYRQAMGVNLDGAVFGIHAAVPVLSGRPSASIVVTASLAGLIGLPGEPIYSANKHALVGLVRSLGPTLMAEHQVRINALCPGFTDTPLLSAELKKALADMEIPLLTTDEVVAAFAQILDDDRCGECWCVQPGRLAEPFRFAHLPGPRPA